MVDGYDSVIVGSGVIGLTLALSLSRAGSVAIVDPHPGSGASYVAAGMLAPVTETAFGEDPLTAFNLAGAAAWPGFAAELEEAAGAGIGLVASGTLVVAKDAGDRAGIEHLYAYQRRLGLDVAWCEARECLEYEPLLSPSIAGGIFAAGDHQVDNRRLLHALGVACARAGVVHIEKAVSAVLTKAERCVGVLAGGDALAAGAVVLAAGYRSARIGGVPDELAALVRPVKGQLLRLRAAAGTTPLRTVRALVRASHVYTVPRTGGEVVLGASVEERGEDRGVTAGVCYELLRDAVAVLPSLKEAEVIELCVGLRPGTPDNAPLLGPSGLPGLHLATGHYRHGILLAPITARAVTVGIETGALPPEAAAFSPGRFAGPDGARGPADLVSEPAR